MNSNLTILPEDDPQALKCAANLLARFTNRVLNPPRLPHDHEHRTLSCLQTDLKTQFSPNTHDQTGGEKLLKRLWLAFYGKDVPYARYSKKWGKMGFQHNKDPCSDFRGGGLLSLQCLVYLFEKQPAVAKHLYELQSVRVGKRGEYANYPFACAGITLVKKLCEMLFICEPMTGKSTRAFENSSLTFWQVAGNRTAFYELFVWSFMVLDKLWDEMGATYMDFGPVMRIATQRITNVLLRLPNDVVPSGRSFMIAEEYESLNEDGNHHFVYENTMSIEDSDSESEEEKKDDKHRTTTPQECIAVQMVEEEYSRLPSASSLVSLDDNSSATRGKCLTEDLLGLDDSFSLLDQPMPFTYNNDTSNSSKKDHSTSTWQTASQTQNFFEEFGLEL